MSEMPRELTSEEMENLTGLSGGIFPYDLGNGLIAVDDVHVENQRWNEERLVVFRFKNDSRLFGLTYWNGLTELQEGNWPGCYEGNHGEFIPFEVKAITKTITSYEAWKEQ